MIVRSRVLVRSVGIALEIASGLWAAIVFLITCANDSMFVAWTADTDNVRNPLGRRAAGISAGILLCLLIGASAARILRRGKNSRIAFYLIVALGVLGWPILYSFLPHQYTV